MKDLTEIKELLLKAKRVGGSLRAETISKLQDKIWDATIKRNEDAQYMLDLLAGDLNFYESDERDRDESLGYYGEAKLEAVINSAIQEIVGFLKET